MRVMVTGARRWTDWGAVYDALWGVYKEHGPFLLVHGACSTGADQQADQWFITAGRYNGCAIERFPAEWCRPDGTVNKAAGFERNARMVEAGADLVLAFPLPEGRGTQHTVKLAREAGIPVIEHTKVE